MDSTGEERTRVIVGDPLPEKTLAQAVAEGSARPEDIGDWIEAWHEAPREHRRIHEALGMTEEGYLAWLKEPGRAAELLQEGRAESLRTVEGRT